MKRNFLLLIVVFTLASGFIFFSQKKEQPNILFLEVDDLTAKYLGAFGATFAKTPNVDALASQGVVFNNALCQGTMCAPSRNSLITALYPHNMGLYENGQLPALPKGVWTFPKALQKAGYQTFWVGKNHLRPNQTGIREKDKVLKKNKAMQELGFDYVYQTSGRVVALRGVRQAMKDGRTWQTGEDVYGDYLFKNGLLNKFVKENGKVPTTLDGDTAYLDGHFTTVALQQLNSYSGNKPFFMWLNFSTPHGPYDVPKRFHDMFKPEDLPPAIEASTEKFQIPAALKRHKSNLSKAEIASDRAAYSATIAYMDEQIGRVLKFLRNSKFADNTIVVFFSDQGVMAGDHGLQHKSTLFKEILNPALIIYYPKQFKPSRVKTPVELLDLAKTVLDIAGADESILKECPNGNSLLPFLTGKGKFSGNGLAFAEIEGFIAVYDGRYKYFENAELPILFDLENDPDETNNFVASNPKKAFELREQVLSWMKRTGEFKKPARPANDDEED